MAEAALLSDAVASSPPAPETPALVPIRAVGEGPAAAQPTPAAAQATPAAAQATPAAAPRRLKLPPYELEAALRLERELGVSHVLAQILVRRGWAEPPEALAFLDAGVRHHVSGFAGIETALELIRAHIAAGSRITVHGDYDVDGICATAIMVRALRALGANVNWFLPSRLEDGYGLGLATIQRLAERGTGLILTVDCAITAVEEVAAARAAGMDVLVTDHHAPRADGALPDCPILHPGVCGYPFPGLCGTAVAHKLAEALGAETAPEDIELVAIATVADLVPLLDENRRLVREGLAALTVTAKPGLRALMSVSRADPSALDAGTVGFRLAPRINAAGRLRRADAGLELLLTEDPERAREIALELDAVNAERRAVEQRILWEAEALVAELGPRSAYVLWSEDWHPGVVGIVASRIVDRHHRPCVLVALDGSTGSGSGRSISGFDLLGALHATAGALTRYGGHRAAAGLTIERAELEGFRAAFEHHAEAVLTPDLLEPVERADAVVSGSGLGLALAEELERLEPCGMGNPSPRLLVPGARFTDVRPMGEGRHARFSVVSGGARARAVAFGCDGRLATEPEQPCDATFRLERNTWNGAVEARLVLSHEQPCGPGPIEIIGEPADYLASVLAELELGLGVEPRADCPQIPPDGPQTRIAIDRRGESPLAVLTDAMTTGGRVLAVCADVPRRLDGLRARVGGFALAGYHALEAEPALAREYRHVVALDPPADGASKALLRVGEGFTHLTWGSPELRFAEQMHELEYGLRASLVAFYRALRDRERAAGEELEHLLRGDGRHGRSARLAARLVRVLAELELVSLDRDLPALAIAGRAPTALERSPSYRVYAQRYEDGRRFLSSANLPPSG
jgi:single-stranded-DNA-specific exonuclease